MPLQHLPPFVVQLAAGGGPPPLLWREEETKQGVKEGKVASGVRAAPRLLFQLQTAETLELMMC